MSEEASIDEFVDADAGPLFDEPRGVRLGIDETYPQNWKYAELNKVCKVNSGFSWSKEQERDEAENGTIPVIKIGNVQDGYLDLTNILHLTGVSDKDLRENKARKDWLLMIGSNGSGERVGHCGLIEKDMEFVYASFLYGLRADSNYLLPRYLFYNLNRPNVQRRLTSFTAGSTSLKNLNKSTISNLSVPTPPLEEQRKIATVLYTVDQAIQKTEEIIEEIERIKSGVSQQYFQEYNAIRREENPEPTEIVELSDLVEFKPGKAWKTNNLSDDGIKVVRISNLTGDKEEFWRYDDDYEERRAIEDGDLLFSWAGMKSSIGVHLHHGEKALLNQHIYNLVPNASISRKYLYYYLDYRMSDLYSLSQGGAVQIHLTKDIIERILIPKLSSEKRKSIVAHLTEVDNALQNEVEQKAQLKRLKQGLMQDLLSGTVRTHEADIEVPESVLAHD